MTELLIALGRPFRSLLYGLLAVAYAHEFWPEWASAPLEALFNWLY